MTYTIERRQYSVGYFIHQLKTDKYVFPKWQREDCWKLIYKQELIMSILYGIDIPKIYLGDIKDSGEVFIIDGGHRSRSIHEFMLNQFSALINGVSVYYDKSFSKDSPKYRNLSSGERKKFDNFHLDVVEYLDISEKECKAIFNKLQNARPMSIDDVINSWQSDLVDFLRETLKHEIGGQSIHDLFKQHKLIDKPNKTSIMSQLLSWYTILYPNLEAYPKLTREIVSLKFLAKGNNNDSPALNYVKIYKEDISQSMKEAFYGLINDIIIYYRDNDISPSDMNTLIHAKSNYPNFNIQNYKDILSEVKSYDSLKKTAEKLNNEKKYDESKLKFEEAESLNNSYNMKLEMWNKSRKDGGNNPSGMKKRMDIMKEYCLD